VGVTFSLAPQSTTPANPRTRIGLRGCAPGWVHSFKP
jgi:hypothetical protein